MFLLNYTRLIVSITCLIVILAFSPAVNAASVDDPSMAFEVRQNGATLTPKRVDDDIATWGRVAYEVDMKREGFSLVLEAFLPWDNANSENIGFRVFVAKNHDSFSSTPEFLASILGGGFAEGPNNEDNNLVIPDDYTSYHYWDYAYENPGLHRFNNTTQRNRTNERKTVVSFVRDIKKIYSVGLDKEQLIDSNWTDDLYLVILFSDSRKCDHQGDATCRVRGRINLILKF